jgi:lipid II:glycine glycyltransferase (peptidoglycan interpeptide bridge formation enzyme)
MKRVNADSKYFFDKNYFYSLLKSTGFYCELLLVIHVETKSIIAGSIFTGSNNLIHHHLSASSKDFLKLSPTTLLNDEIRINSSKKGYLQYNLGGGLNGERDSLFNYKSYFSKDYKTFKVWKYIVDQDIYNDLVKKNNINKVNNYFPLYRYNQ